jgi:hypothetical protein
MFMFDAFRAEYLPALLHRVHGSAPELWDGCAEIMGNCTDQWRATYNFSKKRRAASLAVEAHNRFRTGLIDNTWRVAASSPSSMTREVNLPTVKRKVILDSESGEDTV